MNLSKNLCSQKLNLLYHPYYLFTAPSIRQNRFNALILVVLSEILSKVPTSSTTYFYNFENHPYEHILKFGPKLFRMLVKNSDSFRTRLISFLFLDHRWAKSLFGFFSSPEPKTE